MAKATVAKKRSKGHRSQGLTAARARGRAHFAIVDACAAVYAAYPDHVKMFTREIRKACRCSLPDARNSAVKLALNLTMDHGEMPIYVGRLKTLRR